jgi:hypothetical protein
MLYTYKPPPCIIVSIKKAASYPLGSFNTYIHIYHSRVIPEEVAEASQIFLRDTHVLLKLISYEE